MAVTLRDLADAAGVSTSTASRALRGSPRISSTTRKVVEEKAAELGYRVNRTASALRSRRSNLVGLVLNNLVNASFHTIADVVQRRLGEAGLQLILSTTDADPRAEAAMLETLASHGVDGILVMGTGQNAAITNELLREGIAVVNVIRSSPDSFAPTVLAGDRDGSYEATRSLLRLGHRRIGFIGGVETADSGRARLRGYRDALEAEGVAFDESLVVNGSFTSAFGEEAAAELIGRATGMTALFVANHEASFGVLPVLTSRGIRVPDDLSLLCYEDMQMLSLWHPPVTVVDTGPSQIGELAVDLLVGQIRAAERGEPLEQRLQSLTRTYRVEARLVSRASCAPLLPEGDVS